MMTPRPDLLPPGATLVEWKLTPEIYEKARPKWRQWGPGPWEAEPDRIEWRIEGSKLPRLAIRGPLGAWCGYVGLPEGHPMHGKSWDDDVYHELRVHGGLTYGEACAGNICHVPREGESDHVWWLGFDCAHAGDIMPGMQMSFAPLPGEAYRDTAYVIMQVELLAAQLEGAER